MIGFMPNNYLAAQPRPVAAIFVTTDERTPVRFTVEMDISFNISRENRTAEYGRTTVVRFPTGIGSPDGPDIRLRTRRQRGSTPVERNKYIRVKAEDGKNITVFGLNDEDISTDAFLALPCQSYDGITEKTPYEYFIFSANILKGSDDSSDPGNFHSAFLIVTCVSNTTINILPSQSIEFDGNPASAGGSLTLSYQESRQTIYIEAARGEDLTGTIVTSNRPISVFAGHVCGRVPADRSGCNHLVEQIPPHVVWGTTFFTVPLARRMAGDRFIVGAIRDNTVINVTCTTLGSTMSRFSVTKNRTVTPPGSNYYMFDTPGDSPRNHDLNYQAYYCCIETNFPVAVMQYSKGYSVDNLPDRIGDPFMLLVPPVAQYLNNFTVTTAKEVRTTFDSNISIAISTKFFTNTPEDQVAVLINGTQAIPEAGWIPIYCSSGSICGYGAQIGTPVGASTLVFDKTSAAMNAYVYGFEREISFAYPAGFEMEPIGCKLKCMLMQLKV